MLQSDIVFILLLLVQMTAVLLSDSDQYVDETAKYFCDIPELELRALNDDFKIRTQRTDFLKKMKGKGKKFSNDYIERKPPHPDLRQAALIERNYQKGCKGASYKKLIEQFGHFNNILYLESNYKEQVNSVDVIFLWCYSDYWCFGSYLPEILRAAHYIKVKWGDKIAIAMCDVAKFPKAKLLSGSKYSYYYFSILWNGKFRSQYRGDISASSIKFFLEKDYRDYNRKNSKALF